MRSFTLLLIPLVALGVPTVRHDTDGMLISRLVANLDRRSAATLTDRTKLIRNAAGKHLYPPEFMVAFLDVFYPDFPNRVLSISDALERLSIVSVDCALQGLGICLSMVGFLLNNLPSSLQSDLIQSLLQVLPDDIVVEEDSLAGVFYRAGMESGSTFGTLGYFRNRLSIGTRQEDFCLGVLPNSLESLAEETAVDDTTSEWMGPSVVDFEASNAPIDSLTVMAIEASGAGLGYLLSIMKENAEALATSFLFDPLETLVMMGVEGVMSEDELRQSVEGMSGADEGMVAQELIDGIHSVRYNLNAARYNQGVAFLESHTSCLLGLFKFREVIASQNLLVKTLFFMMKANFFRFRDNDRAFLTALLLSDSGVLMGDLNAINLASFARANPVKGATTDTKRVAKLSGMGKTCRNAHIHEFRGDKALCLSHCSQRSDCTFAVHSPAYQQCQIFNECDVIAGPTTGDQLFEAILVPHSAPCDFLEHKTEECVTHLHERAAAGHNHTDSMHWLVRTRTEAGDIDRAYLWADKSASIGDGEGKFYLGEFLRIGWSGHPPNLTEAKRIFWDLLIQAPKEETVELPGEWELADELEFEAVQDICAQLGIVEDGLGNSHHSPSPLLARRVAGLTGLALTYMQDFHLLLPRIVTILALFPVLFMLISRRVRLV